jgi:hypothetical protein
LDLSVRNPAMTAIVPSRDPTFCATLVLNQPGKDAVSWPERKPCNGGVMTLEVWQRSVSGHLVILLDAVRQELAHDPINFSGWFERVLPWGMDDGEGLVRLTVLQERTSPFDPRQFRVALDAKAKAFVFGHETVLDVSRFAKLLEANLHGLRDRVVLDAVPDSTAGRFIEFLSTRHGGGPVCREQDGSLSFTVVL